MKRIMVILFLFNVSLAGAQSLSKLKRDWLTGDTAQFSRAWALHKPLTWLLDHTGAIIGWRIEKTKDSTFLYMQIDDPRDHFALSKDSSQLKLTFSAGPMLQLPASYDRQFTNPNPVDDRYDKTFWIAKYPLSAADLHKLMTGTIVNVTFNTASGPQQFSIPHAFAKRLQRKLTALAKNSAL